MESPFAFPHFRFCSVVKRSPMSSTPVSSTVVALVTWIHKTCKTLVSVVFHLVFPLRMSTIKSLYIPSRSISLKQSRHPKPCGSLKYMACGSFIQQVLHQCCLHLKQTPSDTGLTKQQSLTRCTLSRRWQTNHQATYVHNA